MCDLTGVLSRGSLTLAAVTDMIFDFTCSLQRHKNVAIDHLSPQTWPLTRRKVQSGEATISRLHFRSSAHSLCFECLSLYSLSSARSRLLHNVSKQDVFVTTASGGYTNVHIDAFT